MSDGACCHYCRRYKCICRQIEAAKRAKMQVAEVRLHSGCGYPFDTILETTESLCAEVLRIDQLTYRLHQCEFVRDRTIAYDVPRHYPYPRCGHCLGKLNAHEEQLFREVKKEP